MGRAYTARYTAIFSTKMSGAHTKHVGEDCVGLSGGLMAAGGHASQRYCCTSPGTCESNKEMGWDFMC